ncbi:MAG: RnfABCDGE type electron transport complex subunit D [Bacillota bacterium]|jgi:Na+-transporting NADH:ubiquinone oxidoreductase subunit B|nr:RnfABCDGE type electron transport complex subunit D [Bacillota bacterium]HHT90070.1 RnfABCDGE type electron transport complex subunit D [Bacillota bacterium]
MDLRALFLRQGIMRRVVISLLPILLFAVYSFGLRILVLLAVVTIAGVLTEYLILRFMKGNAKFKIPEAIFVTCILFTLILPSTVPFWVAVVGIAFGVLFGKGVFGGFGKNIFNPALVGRCFVFISFPSSMTVTWAAPFQGFPGGFVRYSTAVDSISAATPLVQAGGDLLRLLLGQISGSSGEISALLIVLAAVYLVVTKTASWRIMVSCVLGFIGVSTVFYLAGATASTPLVALLTGGFLFSAVFMATDPISAPRDKLAQVIFGVLVGMLAITIRTFSVFREGAMFAILLGNAFGPLIQMKVKQWKQRRMVVSER